jgi:hypothetical protein
MDEMVSIPPVVGEPGLDDDDDFDVLADGVVVGRIMKAATAPLGLPDVRLSRRSHADARVRGDPRGRDGRLREKLAAGVGAP